MKNKSGLLMAMAAMSASMADASYNRKLIIRDKEESRTKSSMTEEEKMKSKGMKQWSEYGNVWAASRKAAIKKFNKLKS